MAGRHFLDDNFKLIFLNENIWILIKISPKFISKGRIKHMTALLQIIAWLRTGNKPLSEPMTVKFTGAYMRQSVILLTIWATTERLPPH